MPLRCKFSHYSHPLSLYINRNKRAIRPLSACRTRAFRPMPSHNNLCLYTSGLGIRTSGLGLRTSDLRLLHIRLTSISHRTCAYPTSDLRLSHIGLTPIPHQTCTYPTFRLEYAHIRAVPTHMRTCKQTPTSLCQRACIRYLRTPAF